ncbi:cyclin-dependent kinase 20-like isoform X1 [Daktulosphaira vitifoliae]|uniref:cyclin-dependent kinase 20-like isoform X1 n=1 Tax=Daktulosphaira vitifoliae TaxID=58002 RepID=UPI0021AA7005|nr:cyclin-dependent kinase 20-like isoform X1 [Daktulosphaira vitifoliae]
MENYKIIERIGEGTHGQVVKALHRPTSKIVALKCVNSMDKTTKNVLREIESLRACNSDYIITLTEHFCHCFSTYLVLEYMVSGLSEMLLDESIILNESHLKSYARMLLNGTAHIHSLKIIHRDLKPSNLLISSNGILKIADFSLSRSLLVSENENSKKNCYTNQVATRRYRAPELLFGSTNYNQSIDMWSVGCIIAEMFTKTPLFPGDTDLEQIAMVVHYLGTPNNNTWPNRNEMPDFNKLKFTQCSPIPMKHLLPDINKNLVNLIESLIMYDSYKRLDASEALKHSYFFNDPLPCLIHKMPVPPQHQRLMSLSNNPLLLGSVEQNFKSIYRILQELS